MPLADLSCPTRQSRDAEESNDMAIGNLAVIGTLILLVVVLSVIRDRRQCGAAMTSPPRL